MNIDKIVQVDITISTSTTIDGGYDRMLIVGPLPETAGGKTTPDVASYTSLDELSAAGFASTDPVFKAAQVAFGQSPRPKEIYIAVRKKVAGDTEVITDTLFRAKATSGWYAICPVGVTEDEIQKIAAWVESNEKICVFQTTSLTTNPVQETMSRSAAIHAKSEDDYINAALIARFLSYDPGSEMWAYKSLAAVNVQDLSDQETKTMDDANIMYFTKLGNANVVVGGKMASGEWIDTVRFCDWLKSKIQENEVNLFLQYSKIPYTKEGIALVESALRAALDEGVKNGGIAAPEISDNVQVPSYTITVPSVSEITAATRKTRKLLGVKWTARLAGAINSTAISGTVNY